MRGRALAPGLLLLAFGIVSAAVPRQAASRDVAPLNTVLTIPAGLATAGGGEWSAHVEPRAFAIVRVPLDATAPAGPRTSAVGGPAMLALVGSILLTLGLFVRRRWLDEGDDETA